MPCTTAPASTPHIRVSALFTDGLNAQSGTSAGCMPGSLSSSSMRRARFFFLLRFACGDGIVPCLYLMRPLRCVSMEPLLRALEAAAHASTCSDDEVGAIGVEAVRLLHVVGLLSLAEVLSENVRAFFIREPQRPAPPRDMMRLVMACLVAAGTQSALTHLPDAAPAVVECVYATAEHFLNTKIERGVSINVPEVCGVLGCDPERLSGWLGAVATLASKCSL